MSASGEAYVWGYGKACGSKEEDVLAPRKCQTYRNNVVAVAGGGLHSMALSGDKPLTYEENTLKAPIPALVDFNYQNLNKIKNKQQYFTDNHYQ